MASVNFVYGGPEPQTRSAQVQIEPTAESGSGSEAAPDVTDLGAIAGTEGGAAAPNLDGAPVTEIKPAVGMLSLRYVNGAPQIVVSGGKAIPAGLTVVDAAGAVVATYTARSTAALRTGIKAGNAVLVPDALGILEDVLVIDDT